MSTTHKFAYANLNHAQMVQSVGATWLRDTETAAGSPVFTFHTFGPCACLKEGQDEIRSIVLDLVRVADIIGELTRAATEAGVGPALTALVDEAVVVARDGVVDLPESGHLRSRPASAHPDGRCGDGCPP